MRTSLGLLWLMGLWAGFAQMAQYDGTAGDAGSPPAVWPTTALPRTAGQTTLLVAAHPHCPCTRATLDQLEAMAVAVPGLQAEVLFVQPAGESADWAHSDLWRRAERIPGVHARLDAEGRESRRFGLNTSGHALVYDGQGRLVFSGGLTAGRGQLGASLGADAAMAALSGKTVEMARARVYGCSLLENRP